MKIILDGINFEERHSLNNIIIDMEKRVFGETNSNIKEIIVTTDFRKVVNSKHRRNFPDQEYILKNDNTTLAKNFRVGNNCSEIVLNSILYMREKGLFFSTLYHEIVHAKFYNDIINYNYSKICVEDAYENKDGITEVFTFRIIDEYNAYKKTFQRYPSIVNNYLDYFKYMRKYFDLLKNDDYNWFNDGIDYMNKMTSCLSIVFALFAVDESNVNDRLIDSYIIQNSTFKSIRKLYELLHGLKNGIPENNEFIVIKDYVKKIFNLVNWEE